MEMTNKDSKKIRIPSYTDNKDIASLHQEFLGVIDRFYYTVVRVDLLKDTVCILQCADHPEAVSKVVRWRQYLEASSGIFIEGQKQNVQESLSSAHLLEMYHAGETFYSLDASYLKNGILNSMTFFVFLSCENDIPLAYIMVRNSTKENLRKRIVDMYIYDNCDFLMYLDAKNNSYTLYNSADNGTHLPPELCKDYALEMGKYIEKVIAPEDRMQVMRDTSIDWVLAQLGQKEVYSFYCGCIEDDRGYRRKRFDYRYYERSTQMILFSCTDITEMYLKEQQNRQALFDALKSAQTDMLTGLLNYKGTIEQISKALEQKPEHAALLFVDIDHFKTVNDSLGHIVGDEVLCQIALILCEESFGESLIGRFGGDEFVVFFPHINSMEEVKAYAQRICRAVFTMEYGQKPDMPHVSCSVGIVEVPKYGNDWKTLIQKADDMAYQAKFTGKNKFVIYESEI